jgi:hypothetical protein
MSGMKFNWGTGILVVIVLFMVLCIAFFIFASRQDNSLVEKDYYPKGLKYEEMIGKIRNAAGLGEVPEMKLDKDFLKIKYPSYFKGKDLAGRVYFYRPSDANLDFTSEISFDTALVQLIPASRFRHGRYQIQFDWMQGIKSYYIEKEIFVP